ncbi:Hsp20/alpha crystallin family protein [bacterium]|nr:Hsp20/alpha crystallin family protein [bacterium]
MSESKKRRHPSRPSGGPFDPLATPVRPWFSLAGQPWVPQTDVAESEEFILIRMEVAGISMDELSVTQEEQTIVVQGYRSPPPREEHCSYQLMEIQYGPFERVFEFPASLELEEITATYDAGFLNIRIRKTAKAPRKPISLRIKVQEES